MRRAQRPQLTIPCSNAFAFARYAGPARIVSIEVVHQLPAVRHELVPVNISRVGVLETDRPILGRDGHDPDPLTAGLSAQRVRAPSAIDVGTSIGRVLQDLDDAGTVSHSPNHLMWRRTEKRPHWQHQVATPQIAHDRLGAAQLPELGKHQAQPLLYLFVYLFVRIEGDTAVT